MKNRLRVLPRALLLFSGALSLIFSPSAGVRAAPPASGPMTSHPRL